jgi:hypothetical protein
MLERKTVKYKFKLTALALANKLARIVYALATKGGHYDDRPVGLKTSSVGTRFRRKAIRTEGDGEAM